jgi:LDH2 family malate/lactate/ureidoglycolate dehydrogenase
MTTSTTPATTTLTVSGAHTLAVDALVGTGWSIGDATTIADHLIDCELRGLGFGGLARALSIIERRSAGPPPGPVVVTHETAVSAALDGGDQVGYLVATRAVDIALDKASEQGIAVVGARNTWYTGMFSYYLERIAAAGLVGMIAGSGPAVVAPHGGTEGRFGTNPIAFGFPTDADPIIYDIGTSALMYGAVHLARRLGEDLPPHSAFGPEGEPTLDPDEALAGALAVWGGHKGSGLALVVQLLGMLAGADANPPGLTDCGFLVVVIDPDLLGATADFATRAAAFADRVRATRPVVGNGPVRVPFDRSAHIRAQTRARGEIEVPTPVVENLRHLSEQ